MTNYWELRGFEHLYLEDSWVLSIEATENSLAFDMDLVLRESHPNYRPPRAGEQYCYRRGFVTFTGVTTLTWTGQGGPPATDANGEQDLGSIDEFEIADNRYTMSGDFGRIQLIAQLPTVEFVA